MVRSIYEKWCVPFSFLCYTKHSVNLKGETDNGKKKCMEDIHTGTVKRTESAQKYAWMKERRRENVSV